MKKIIIVVFILLGAYQAWQMFLRSPSLESPYEKPYVIVYGRDSCGWTKKYLSDLENEGIECIYENVDKNGVSDELHPQMEAAGLNTRRYHLPVIDVNGEMFIRPKMETILEAYHIEFEVK